MGVQRPRGHVGVTGGYKQVVGRVPALDVLLVAAPLDAIRGAGVLLGHGHYLPVAQVPHEDLPIVAVADRDKQELVLRNVEAPDTVVVLAKPAPKTPQSS